MRKRNIRTMFSICFLVLGFLLAGYPYFSNRYCEVQTKKATKQYEKKVAELSQQEKAMMMGEADEYNRILRKAKVILTDPFDPKVYEKEYGEDSVLNRYENLLSLAQASQQEQEDISKTSSVMGYIKIPCIGVELPIFHGCSEEVLLQGAGHLKGSSIPVGGKGTHCVLTGHTGLNRAKMFTDLHEMKEGDLFMIYVLDKQYTYCTDQIKVVRPENTVDLQIESQEDYVTLVTCTPYGINDHRLLVRGHRIKNPKEEIKKERRESLWMKKYKTYIQLGAVAMTIVCACRVFGKKVWK